MLRHKTCLIFYSTSVSVDDIKRDGLRTKRNVPQEGYIKKREDDYGIIDDVTMSSEKVTERSKKCPLLGIFIITKRILM